MTHFGKGEFQTQATRYQRVDDMPPIATVDRLIVNRNAISY